MGENTMKKGGIVHSQRKERALGDQSHEACLVKRDG